MTKLAIIDLDGVVADNTARFEKAEEAKQAFLAEVKAGKRTVENSHKSGFVGNAEKEATNLFWQTAFNPDLVALDTLIEGVEEALDQLQFTYGYNIVFLTSRPESMRDATSEWLYYHKVNFYRKVLNDERQLVMKSPAFQYTKTVTWKAGMVQMLASLFEASEVLFVDDEQANRDIVMDSYLDGSINLIVASSLAEALEKLKEDEE